MTTCRRGCSRVRWFVGLALVVLLGCATPNKRADRAIEAYKHGDWQTALSRFVELEEDGKVKSTKRNTRTLDAMNERWYLRYHVFRGLAHWARYQSEGLDDIDQLRQAYEHLQAGPRAVRADRRGLPPPGRARGRGGGFRGGAGGAGAAGGGVTGQARRRHRSSQATT